MKDTFEVHILAFIKQRLVLIKHKIMAPPNVSDKNTRRNLVVLYQISAKQQQKLMGRPAWSAQRNRWRVWWHKESPLNKFAAGGIFRLIAEINREACHCHVSPHPVRDEFAPAPVLGNPPVALYRACGVVYVAADVQVGQLYGSP